MSRIDIDSWLRGLGLERYIDAFAENDIDEDTLKLLTEADLEELGVESFGHRRRILSAIARLTAPSGVPEPMATADGSGPMAAAAVRGERRAVTVLFCDIAEFSKLSSERDAEDVHALLNHYYETVDSIVERFGGHVDKHIGDTVMAVFGAPRAHTNDPERAVRAAFEIRNAVRYSAPPIRVHTGIASGAVVASRTGSATHVEYTVTGNAVNLASRLHDLAGPHEILVSDSVKRAVAPWVKASALRDVTIKGMERAVQVWRLDHLHAEATGNEPAPLVGRDAELATMEELLTRCREQRQCQLLHIRGHEGIGKSRLVAELCAMAQARGFSCHTARAVDFGQVRGPIYQLACSLLALGQHSTAAERKDAAHTARYLGLVAEEHELYLHELLDVPHSGPQRRRYDAMTPAARNRGKRDTLAGLIRRRAGKRPQVIAIEDIHWADPEVASHIAHLGRGLSGAPVLLVVTSRLPGRSLPELAAGAGGEVVVTTMDLEPLARDHALALARHLGAESDFVGPSVDRADGNPLFLEQLVRTAEESAQELLPGSIQSIVQARIDYLDDRDKQALQAASVLGQRFTLEALRFLLDDPEYTCDSLLAHQLVCGEGADYVFAHSLVLEGVYSSLLKARQRSLHLRAAEWFAGHHPGLRAEHLERAEDGGAPRAYLEAARAQTAEYRFERAIALCERGLNLCRGRARHDEYELSSLRAELLYTIGAIAEALAELERAAELAQCDEERCRVWVGMAQSLRVVERMDEARDCIERAHAVAEERGLRRELATIHHLRGSLLFFRGDIAGCLDQHTAALDHARAVGSAEAEARALSGLGDAYYLRGRMLTAHRQYCRCIALSREHGLGSIEVANLSMRGVTRYYQNQLEDGLTDVLDGANTAAQVGQKRAELIARNGGTGWILFEMGRMDEARSEFEAARELSRSLGARRFEPVSLVFIGKILARQGRAGEGRAMVERGLALCRDAGMGFAGPMVLSALAVVTADGEARRRTLAKAEKLLATSAASHNYLYVYRDAMDVALALGDPELVERYAGALEAYTRPEPLPWSRFFVARGRALAQHLRGIRTPELEDTLQQLLNQARSAGLHLAAVALQRALSGRPVESRSEPL